MVSLSYHIVVGLSKEVVNFLIQLFSVTMITDLFLIFLVNDVGTVTLLTVLLCRLTCFRYYGNRFTSFLTAAFASCKLSICLLTLFLLVLHFKHTIMFDSLDFLPHSKELYHLLCINSSRDKLSDGHFILLVQGSVHVVIITIHFRSLLFLLGSILFLLFVVSFSKFGVDNSQSEIEKEECSNKHNQSKVHENKVGVSFLQHDLDITPAFQSYTLKYCQHRIWDIIKIWYTEIWIRVGFTTKVSSWATLLSTAD